MNIATTPLYGLSKPEAQLAQAIDNNSLPSAYLFTGMQGIGKSTLARKLAACLLTDGNKQKEAGLFGDALPSDAPTQLNIDEHHPAITRMESSSHPDFLWLRPAYDEKKKIFKADITIDQTRKISEFLSLTAGEGAWKIVIVDTANAMNNAAANALLKWLEEPPARSLFILISHAPGALLPTIKSRCRILNMAAPSFDDFTRLMPMSMDDTSRKQLYRLTGGSPGLALTWADSAWQDYWHSIINLSTDHSTTNLTRLSTALAKDTAFPLTSVQLLIDSLLTRITKYQATGELDAYADTQDEAQAIQSFAIRHPLQTWLTLWDDSRNTFNDAARLYLDKQQVLFNILSRITTA